MPLEGLAPPRGSGLRPLLIVGSRGYLGSHCVVAAHQRGWAVQEWKSSSSDPKPLLARVASGAFVAVINAAAAPFGVPEPDHVNAYIASNVSLPQALGAAAFASLTPLVHVGTRWSLGSHGDAPNSLYGATKALGDYLAAQAPTLRSPVGDTWPRAVVRVRDLIGPKDHRGKLPALLLDAAQSGAPLAMTDGTQLVDPMDVRDVAEALLDAVALLLAGSSLPVFNEIQHQPITVREFVREWEIATGLRAPILWGQLPPRGTELFSMEPVHPLLETFHPRPRRDTYRSTIS